MSLVDELQRNLCEAIEMLLEDGEADAAWETEIARRIARFDAGDVETVPASEVFARLRVIAPDR